MKGSVVRVGAIALVVIATYVLLVPLMGAPGVLAALVVGVGFPFLLRVADRALAMAGLRDDADPLESLASFLRRPGGVSTPGSQLAHMARIVGRATAAQECVVRLRVGDDLVELARWTESSDGPGTGPWDVFPVWNEGQLLGAIELDVGDEPLSPTERRLVGDLASQARLVLRNEQLTARLRERAGELETRATELQLSRRRVVAAHDEERRQLERDIHDGAQQQLLALSVRIALAEKLMDRTPDRGPAVLDEARSLTEATKSSLETLARGLYPPRLVERGLIASLSEQGAAATVPVRVVGDLISRPSVEIEAAAYFVCLEALHNALRHARAKQVIIRIDGSAEQIRFAIVDDGRGFDPSVVPTGAGLASMRDRAAALGGEVLVRSAPEKGTVVEGHVPLSGAQ